MARVLGSWTLRWGVDGGWTELADRVLEAQLARAERAEERESLQRTHDGTEYPDFLPTIRGLRVDGSGRIWMQISRAADALEPPSRRVEHWVILDDEGDRVVGRLELPMGHRLLYADDEGVLTWFEGDLDVPYVEWRLFVAG